MPSNEGFQRFLGEIGGRPLLTEREERELAERSAAGDTAARDELVTRNIGLVIAMARKYANFGFDLEELVQEGLFGLTKAVVRFDVEKGYRLSTYATWWIKHSIFRFMNGAGGETIRVPGKVKHLRREVDKLAAKEHISREEAALEMGIEPQDFVEAFAGPHVAASLDASRTEGEDGDRYEAIPDPHADDPAEQHVMPAREADLKRAMAGLDPQVRKVVELRFGFDRGKIRGTKEVAAEMGITSKQVQAAQAEALAHLRKEMAIRESDRNGTDPVAAVLGAAATTPESGCERE